MGHLFAACLMMAAQTYSVPAQVLVGILHVEGGKIGQQVANKNGSYDLGPMQINTIWVPELAKTWKVPQRTAMRWLRDDGCTNVNVAAWILRQHLDETGSLARAVAHYHSRTPSRGANYKRKVVEVMRKKGLLGGAGTYARQPVETAENPPKAPASRIRIGRTDEEAEDKG